MDFFNQFKTIAIVCTQWGDTGKGKIVDLLASTWADMTFRGTGGRNAGHTIVINGQTYVFHLIPSGILNSEKINAIGKGVAFDPACVIEEMGILDKEGISYVKLAIALNAKLVLPCHVVLDTIRESDSGEVKIGTTGRGIGPLYIDHVGRKGLIVNDLLNKDIFAEKLRENLREKRRILATYNPELVKKIMHQEPLEKGLYYDEKHTFDEEAIVSRYMEYGERLKPFITDVDKLARESLASGKRILLEGAQGHLLSIDDGTYPFVTSSDTTVHGLAKGSGLRERDVDLVLGIAKFYITRVGGGPFPTEFGGEKSEKWCAEKTWEDERARYPSPDLNSAQEMERGIAIRKAGGERGATTGRLRRTGRLDLPVLRYVAQSGVKDLIITKADVCAGMREIEICTEYIYDGPNMRYGQDELTAGYKITVAKPEAEIMRYCRPVYQKFPGWEGDISKIKTFTDLPAELKNILAFIEKETDAKVRIVSTGQEREASIFV